MIKIFASMVSLLPQKYLPIISITKNNYGNQKFDDKYNYQNEILKQLEILEINYCPK